MRVLRFVCGWYFYRYVPENDKRVKELMAWKGSSVRPWGLGSTKGGWRRELSGGRRIQGL